MLDKAMDTLVVALMSPTLYTLYVVDVSTVMYLSFHSTIIARVPRTSRLTCTLPMTADQVIAIMVTMLLSVVIVVVIVVAVKGKAMKILL